MKTLLTKTSPFGLNRHFGMTFVLVVALGIALTLIATSSAEAAGFNVNSNVTFTPLASTYRTGANTTGCPAGFAGKFTFTALLTNKPDSTAMPGVTVRVLTLTNGNLLLDPQTNAVLGGEGAEMVVPKAGQYADGLLSSGESVEVPFVLCLKTVQPFQFLVNTFGVVTQLVSINRFGTASSGAVPVPGAGPIISADGRFVVFPSEAIDLAANDTNGIYDVFVRDLQRGTTTLVSLNRFGTASANNGSAPDGISADGRYVLFTSVAGDLVANDTNSSYDVFVRDLQMGTTTLVSVNRFGTGSGNSRSFFSVISADGRFVAFKSDASDLVADDTNSNPDVFVRDLQLGRTTLVSVNRLGTGSGNGSSAPPGISADGRYVLFASEASDLVANDTNGNPDVFVRDLQMGTTTLVSVNRFGTGSGANGYSYGTGISPDGRFVAFVSYATDLVANDTNGAAADVFVRDLRMATTTLVSVNRFGTGSANGDSLNGNSDPPNPVISPDGRFVVFSSVAGDLVANDTNSSYDVFVRDLQMGTTTLVSVNQFGAASGGSGPGISPDGRYVAFESWASDLVADDTNSNPDVFVRDLQKRTTTLVSVNRLGTGSGNNLSHSSVISADGGFVAFKSDASDLVLTNHTTNATDIYVRPVR